VNKDMLAAFMTQLPLPSPPVTQTLFIAISSVTPEPEFLKIVIVLGGMKADSTHSSVIH